MQKKEMVKKKERPILFSGEMVRAILDGRKTQTRRTLKNIIEGDNCTLVKKLSPQRINVRDLRFLQFCHYGAVGDRLWVRETFCIGVRDSGEDVKIYKASVDDDTAKEFKGLWKPSIFMPRWASRILLEITAIRVERLHEISEQDAIAEGIECIKWPDSSVKHPSYTTKSPSGKRIESLGAKCSYLSLWESINGRASLESNPWVWVVEFKRIEVRHDGT